MRACGPDEAFLAVALDFEVLEVSFDSEVVNPELALDVAWYLMAFDLKIACLD